MPKPARRNGTKTWVAMENEVSGRNPLADLVNLQVKPLSFLPWKHSSNCNWVTTMVKHCYPMLSRANGERSGHQIFLAGLFTSNYSSDAKLLQLLLLRGVRPEGCSKGILQNGFSWVEPRWQQTWRTWLLRFISRRELKKRRLRRCLWTNRNEPTPHSAPTTSVKTSKTCSGYSTERVTGQNPSACSNALVSFLLRLHFLSDRSSPLIRWFNV